MYHYPNELLKQFKVGDLVRVKQKQENNLCSTCDKCYSIIRIIDKINKYDIYPISAPPYKPIVIIMILNNYRINK